MPLTMEHLKKIVAFRVTRFGVAGLNCAFYILHQSKLASIVIATSCAIAVSFILNRNYVFIDKARPVKKLARFVAVSVVGVFLIQNSVYALCIVLLGNHESGITGVITSITGYRVNNNFVAINLSNLIASFVVMFWNYNGYRLFVFNGARRGNEAFEDIGTETA
jgi:putative flippase GtrA